MSRHYHAVSEASSIEHDIQHLTPRELEDLYGIQFFENPDSKDGKVFDTVTRKEYDSIHEWAAQQVEEDSWSDAEHHQISRKFDEEF